MSHKILRRINKIDDNTLLKAFDRMDSDFLEIRNSSNIYLSGNLLVGRDVIEDDSKGVASYAIDSAVKLFDFSNNISIKIKFSRMINVSGKMEPSSIYDEFEISLNEPNGSDYFSKKTKEIKNILNIISSLDLPCPKPIGRIEENTLRELIIGFGATHRQMLSDLHDASRSLDIKRQSIEDEFANREAKRLENYNNEIKKLEDEKLSLELQSYRSERRKILKEITGEASVRRRESYTPDGAIFTRWGVFFTSIALSAVGTFLAYSSIVQLGGLFDYAHIGSAVATLSSKIPGQASEEQISQALQSEMRPTQWYLIGRSVVSSAFAVGGLVYAANWLRGFYNAEISRSRDAEKFNDDLIRATWVIETMLEVKHEHDGEIPHEWIEGVTRGLFSEHNQSKGLDDRTEALRALMGFTGSASFGPGGPTFEIGKRDAKKLSEAADAKSA